MSSETRGWRSRLRTLRRTWATAGGALLVVFLLAMAIGSRANADARAALRSDARVEVTLQDGVWRFLPATVADRRAAGLVFFPGSPVDPRAYAPFMREVAEAGYPAFIVSLPWRGAFGMADRPQVRGRAVQLMDSRADVRAWVVAGHSRGGKVAALTARDYASRLAAVVLIGTTHPRDFSLAELSIPVTKVYGSRDWVARPAGVEANRHLLPASANMLLIEGANHSQFGAYGYLLPDGFAAISRARQQELTVAELKKALAAAAAAADPSRDRQ